MERPFRHDQPRPDHWRGPENDLGSDRPELQPLIAVNDLGDDPELGSELIDEGLADVRPVGPLGKEIGSVFEFVDHETRPLSAVLPAILILGASRVSESVSRCCHSDLRRRATRTPRSISERDFAPGSRTAFRNEQHEHTAQLQNARSYSCLGWLGRQDSNLGMAESKSKWFA